MGGFLQGRQRRHAAGLQGGGACRQGRPQQGGEQERRGDRLAQADALVGVGQGIAHQAPGILRVGLERGGAGREQRGEQVVLAEQVEGAFALAGEQQLEDLVEQACRGNVVEQAGQAADRRGAVLLDVEVQLGGEAHRTQHAHRVLEVTLLRIADQAHQAVADVVHAVGVVEDVLAGRVVVQRIDGEVAALGVVFLIAVDVVAQDAPALVARGEMAVLVVLALRMVGAEGGHLDDLAAEMDVDQLEAPADHPRVAELGTHLLGSGAGGDVEVLGLVPEQQVAHAATDQIGLIAGFLQALDHADGVAADLLAAQRVLAAAEDFRRRADGALAAQGRADGLEQLLQHGATGYRMRREQDRPRAMEANSSTGRWDGEREGGQ
ncbi:hypothetical protein D3C78_971680 [compost metagenome]